jgi:hypothetical protein
MIVARTVNNRKFITYFPEKRNGNMSYWMMQMNSITQLEQNLCHKCDFTASQVHQGSQNNIPMTA